MTERKKPLASSYNLLGTVLAFIIGIFFTGLGAGILLNWVIIPNSDSGMSKLFGGLLVVYGVFRLIRVYLKYKDNQNETDEA